MGLARVYGILLLLFLVGCRGPAQSVRGPSRAAAGVEALAGARAAPGVEAGFGGVVRDADAERRMEQVALRLTECTPELRGDYRLRLLKSGDLDAVSLPGGRIYLTQALYAGMVRDDLLAAVVAHEMAHLASRDHVKPRCPDLGCAVDKELSADAYAAWCLECCGYDPSALVEVVRLVGGPQSTAWVEERTANLNARAVAFP